MTIVFEIYKQSGTETTEVEPIVVDLIAEPWYRIRKHNCRNDEQLPCDPWETIMEFGEIPEE